jgi:hypothetical protein
VLLATRVTRLGKFSLIGRLFVLCSFFNCISNPNFLATFFAEKNYTIILTKNGLDYVLGAFFTNSSGHPACKSLAVFFLIQTVQQIQSVIPLLYFSKEKNNTKDLKLEN